MAHADEQDGGHAERRGESHEQAIVALKQCEPDARRHSLAQAAEKPVSLARFLSERLDHSQRPERFLHDGERGTLELFDLSRLAAHAPAIDARHEEEGWRDGQRDDCKLPVEMG